MKGKYLNPKADLTFKLVFGQHKDLAMSFLNALLPLAEDAPITSIEYEPTEMVPERESGKNSIVDVHCTDASGRRFIVEMQMSWHEEFKKRIIMNASKAVMKQVGTAEYFAKIQPVYSLNLLNDKRFQPDTDDFYHDYAILNVDHPERSLDYLRFVFVELPKFKPQNIAERKMMVLWLRFLTEIDRDTETVPHELLENPDTSKALRILEKSAYNEEDLRAYEYYWDAVYNERGAIRHGYKQGMERGMAQGMAQGKAQGIEDNRRDNARRMKADNMPLELIAKYTGLSTEIINSL